MSLKIRAESFLKKKKDIINNKKIIGPPRNHISLESKRAH